MSRLRYYEDFVLGESFTTRWGEVRYDDAVLFARAYDPQEFHTNEAAADRHPIFRGLSASGFYTLTLIHRLVLAEQIGHAWGLIGKGIERLRWLLPVRPGDKIRATGTVIALSRDPRNTYGTMQVEIVATNHAGEPVLAMVVLNIVPSRRVAETSAEAA